MMRVLFGASVAVSFVPLFGVVAILLMTAKRLRVPVWP